MNSEICTLEKISRVIKSGLFASFLICHPVGLSQTPAPQVEAQGSLPTHDGINTTITAQMMAVLLARMPDYDKLLVFTQCYGGDVAKYPTIDGLAKTAIASGTSQGELGITLGYNDDAARALSPGPRRTGTNVHNAGVAGKAQSETPLTAGTKTLASFSLESTKTSTTVKSRVIVIYMGKPSQYNEWVRTVGGTTTPAPDSWVPGTPGPVYTKTPFSDTTDRDRIIANFAGEPNTVIISVGDAPLKNGRAKPGWNQPATRRGFFNAMVAAKGIMDYYQAKDLPSQFILFVGDHGVLTRVKKTRKPAKKNSRSAMLTPFTPLPDGIDRRNAMLADKDNRPSISVLLTPEPGGLALANTGLATSPVSAGQFVLHLTKNNQTSDFTGTSSELVDLNQSGFLGDADGEGININFEIPEQVFLDQYTGAPFDIELSNLSNLDWEVAEIVQHTGSMSRQRRDFGGTGSSNVGVIAAFALLVLILVFWLFRRRP